MTAAELIESFITEVEAYLDDDLIIRKASDGYYKVHDATTDEILGSFYVRTQTLAICPSLDDALVYPAARGRGIGRKVILYFVKKFGALRSDHRGETSPDAEKAWTSLGALPLRNSDQDTGRSRYILFADRDARHKFLMKRPTEGVREFYSVGAMPMPDVGTVGYSDGGPGRKDDTNFSKRRKWMDAKEVIDGVAHDENFGMAGLPGGVRDDPESPNDQAHPPQARL